MKIQIEEIEKVITLLLFKLKESKGSEIELSSDYYWDISIEQMYNPYEEPKEITLGQLSDDWEEIQRPSIVDDAIPYDLKRVAALLEALSVENQIAF